MWTSWSRPQPHSFATKLGRRVAARGLFRVVLSGGETPRALYARLADDLMYRDLPWDRTLVFWGDERHVGATHPDSNYRMAYQTLLSRVPVNPANVFRVRGEEPDAERAARQYEATLRGVLCGFQCVRAIRARP